MKLVFILFGFFLITSCNQSFQKSYQFNEDEKLANEIMKKVAYELKREKDLIPCGTGGQMMDEIEMLALSFLYNKPINIDEGRKLLLTVIDKFMVAINNDKRIRQYLKNYPFLPKNVQVRIFINSTDGAKPPLEQLSVISALDEILRYEIDDIDGKLFKTIHKETYEQALQVISKTT